MCMWIPAVLFAKLSEYNIDFSYIFIFKIRFWGLKLVWFHFSTTNDLFKKQLFEAFSAQLYCYPFLLFCFSKFELCVFLSSGTAVSMQITEYSYTRELNFTSFSFYFNAQ